MLIPQEQLEVKEESVHSLHMALVLEDFHLHAQHALQVLWSY